MPETRCVLEDRHAGIFLISLSQTGPFVQLIPILRDVGLEDFAAATTASLLGVAVIGSRLVCGYLMDKFFAPFVAGAFPDRTCVRIYSICPGTVHMDGGTGHGHCWDWLTAPSSILWDFSAASISGGLAFGKVYGILFAVYSLAVGVAAPLAGWSYDQSGSYVEMFVIGALVNLLAVILILTLGRYPELPVQEKSGIRGQGFLGVRNQETILNTRYQGDFFELLAERPGCIDTHDGITAVIRRRRVQLPQGHVRQDHHVLSAPGHGYILPT